MTIPNKIMLITYPDSLGRNIKETYEIIKKYFHGAVGGVHMLPFFPSSGDRGFAPLTYKKVDEGFGSWEDIVSLSDSYYTMYDFMINHISRRSEYFMDYVKNKNASRFADFFIRYRDFWPEGEPSEKDLGLLFMRRPGLPCIEAVFEDGTSEKVWVTFSDEQIDLNVYHEKVKDFIRESLLYLVGKGASLIRLDAVGYVTKRPGTNCFFVEPDIWDVLEHAKSIVAPYGVDILPEVHEHFSLQLKMAEKGYWVYDFALPMLLLHSIQSGSKKRLVDWMKICPRRQFTTLDTHDGIGVADVRDLMSDEEIDRVKEHLFSKNGILRKMYSAPFLKNFKNYQINCTYYSALDNDDDAYLLARAVQFFSPGVPQVYYVGMLAGENDIELYEKTKHGRDINRHYYTKKEVEENLDRPVVKRLLNLMKFRNRYRAFDGDFEIIDGNQEELLEIHWQNGVFSARLEADFKTCKFTIRYYDQDVEGYKQLEGV